MANTIISISTSGQEFTLPGTHWTPAQVASTFADSVAGIGSMTSEVTTQGEDQLITFRPRTGTKGHTAAPAKSLFQQVKSFVKSFFN